ncbi:hypothetical protein HFM63_001321 [Campylobacter coli]|nr:hypothetical protein [Campylobacter coli]
MKLQDFDFRIWDIQEKHYITNNPCLVEFNHNPGEIKAGVLLVYEDREHEFLESWYDDIEIELWTGLYDKHGKKIYENDILKFSFSFYDGTRTQEVIAYANAITYNGLFFTSKHNGFFPRIDNYSYEQLEENFTFSMEIIGNIHENPELLKC